MAEGNGRAPRFNPAGFVPEMSVAAKAGGTPLRRTLELLPHQARVFQDQHPNVVYVKGRRAGGTTGAVLRLIELCKDHPGSRHLWIDTAHRNIDRVVRRLFLPNIAEEAANWNPTRFTLTFSGGSYVDFGSVQLRENLEGWGYDTLWVNEAGIALRNADLYYSTLQPMLLDASSAQAFFFGTPKGRGLFQRMYGWGQDDTYPDWASFRDASSVNPLLNAALLERLQRTLPERVYRQEVLAEFVDDASQVFRNLERIPHAAPEPPLPGAAYVMGVDLARHRDYTAVWVGRVDTQAAIHCDRFHGVAWQQQVARLAETARRYHDAPAHVDATGVGDAVCEQLEAAGVTVRRETFTNAGKRAMVERLAADIEREAFPFVRDATTLHELEAFAYQPTAAGGTQLGAPPGQHDDCVIALALCHSALHQPRGEFLFGDVLTSLADA